jgi:beta-N-acetylhexosaminidase
VTLPTDRLLMIDLSGPHLTPDERTFLRAHPVGGVCLFARNIQDAAQLAELTAELRDLLEPDLLIATDQEGGGVVRAPFLPYPPGAMALGSANDPALTRAVAGATARGLRSVGINVNFAPVADVNANPANPVIADRAFGSDPQAVARHVVAFVEGHQAAGVAAVVKHFPGHGDTDRDTHLGLATLEKPLEALEALELPPFRAAIRSGVAGVMSFHGLVPAIDTEHPATLSPAAMTGLLRETLGFDGVTFTDALSMKAIRGHYSPAEAAVRAAAAGVDMPLHTGPLDEHEAICKGLEKACRDGRLEPAAVRASLDRLKRLARRYPLDKTPYDPSEDDAVLDEAAFRAVARLGELPAVSLGTRITLVAAREIATSAASQLTATPAETLARALEAAGYPVTRAFHEVERGAAQHAELLERAAQSDLTLFASTARTRMGEAEVSFAREVMGAAPRALHVALWNPYAVLDLPGPALVAFGFREHSARAVVRALSTGEAPGTPPVRLEVR